MRAVLVASVFLALQAHAQTPTPSPTPGATPLAQAPAVPVPLQVERLAPQLVGFAGSPGNFESLVNGLAAGVPVTLTTATADGVTQTVTFTPPGGAVSSPVEIARVLEAARQQLISTGVATPSAQQIATVIAGTSVPATVGVIPPATVTPPGTAGAAAAGGTVPSPAQQIQSRDAPVLPQVNTSDSRAIGNTSNSPVPPPSASNVPQPPAQPVTRAPALAPNAVRR